MPSCLKFADWPKCDRGMWDALVATGGLLNESGLGARWRPDTRKILTIDYGRWLSYLRHSHVDLMHQRPDQRVRPARVASYVGSLRNCAASTRVARIRCLSIIMPRAYPNLDWEWLLRMRRPLDAEERRERGIRKRQRIVASHKLYQGGIDHLLAARHRSNCSPRKRAVAFRDGLAIAFLAACPLRRRNFANLRLGRHLLPTPIGYHIDIPGPEMKNGRPFETLFPADLIPYLEEYLEVYRPVLLSGRRTDRLWISRSGRSQSEKHFGERISKVTERLVGVRVNPHLFRDCAATTIATADPEHVGSIAPLLAHATPRTAELHYNQASSLEAGRALQASLNQLRRQARPFKRRQM